MRKIWFMALMSLAFSVISCSGGDDGPEEEITYYTVTFETDGGTPVPAAQRVEARSTATAPTVSPTKKGYTFMFWHLESSATSYNFQTPVTANITLHAKWKEEATAEYWNVSWQLNGGTWPSGSDPASQVPKGGTLNEPPTPLRTDYTFEGWYKESSLSNKVTFPYDVSNVTAHFTLYAKWKESGSGGEEGDTRMFTTVAALRSWLDGQTSNTASTPYKIGLKNVNLDSGNGWGALGLAIGSNTNKYKFVELDLKNCTGQTIPNGYWEYNTLYGAFVNLTNLTKITLPDGLKTIGDYAFYYCKRMHTVEFPQSLQTIGARSFLGCDILRYFTFPASLRTIGDAAFNSCDRLDSAVFPVGLQSIGEKAFEYTGLVTVDIPSANISIGSSAFGSCPELTTVTLPEGMTTFAFWFAYCPKLTSINIPSTVTTINKYVFNNCTSLATVTLPAGVTSIGDGAFVFCSSLKEVIILAPTPPALEGTIFNNTPGSLRVKVPAGSVEAYRTAAIWSNYAGQIIANTQ